MRHHVVANSEGVLWFSVDLLDLLLVGGEDVKSEGILFLGSEGETELGAVFSEFLLGGDICVGLGM